MVGESASLHYLHRLKLLQACLLRESCGILSAPDLTTESYDIMRENAYFGDMTEFR